MKDVIIKATKDRKVISFAYKGEMRLVEPFAIGYHKTTNQLILHSYRVGGYSKGEHEPMWRNFDVSLMSYLFVTDKLAESEREDYDPSKKMSSILCQV